MAVKFSEFPEATALTGADKVVGLQSADNTQIDIDLLAEYCLGYKVYAAKAFQSGTGTPASTVLKNTTGATFTWSRGGAGKYQLTANSAVLTTGGKTLVFVSGCGADSDDPIVFAWGYNSTTVIDLATYGADDGLADETWNASIEIRIYP